MKKLILVNLLIISVLHSVAQSKAERLKFAIGSHKAVIIFTYDASVDYEGYAGDSLIVENIKASKPIPLEALGLKQIALNNRLPQDSLGYKVSISDSIWFQLKITGSSRHLHIRIPYRVLELDIEAQSLAPNSYVSVRNLKASLMLTSDGETQVSNINGPFSIRSGSKITLKNVIWNPDAVWPFNPADHLLYIVKAQHASDIDITVLDTLKADFLCYAPNGKIYSDLKLDNGIKLNGGGVKISVMSNFGNIYLRTQKAQN